MIKFVKNDGSVKNIEFGWDSRGLGQWVGGVQLNKNDEVAGYMLGYSFDRQTVIRGTQISMQDQAVRYDGFGGVLGEFSAKQTEIEVIRHWTPGDPTFWKFVLGKSNIPQQYSVYSGSSYEDTVAAMKPKITYLTAGAGFDSVRAYMTSTDEEYKWVKFNPGMDWYLQWNWSVGYRQEDTGSDIRGAYFAPAATYGLANQTRRDLGMTLDLGLGAISTFKTSRIKGYASLGYYLSANAGGIIESFGGGKSKTPAGYEFGQSSVTYTGVIGRASLSW